ncbi:MAG: 30S ribosomal protein S5, partial [Candidatus Diapherotrites archaeon]
MRMPRREQKKRKVENEEEKFVESEEETTLEWVPLTEGGRLVKNGEISTLDEYFNRGLKVMEPEIVDILVPELKSKLIEFKKTARITRQGRNFSYRATILVGDENSYVGVGTGKDKERVPAIQKATRAAKMALVKVKKGCGSWECRCNEKHSVPFKVVGKHSSIEVTLMPAPRGTGLVVGDAIKDVLSFVGIKDVWSKTKGNTNSTLEFVSATIKALMKTNKVKLSEEMKRKIGE